MKMSGMEWIKPSVQNHLISSEMQTVLNFKLLLIIGSILHCSKGLKCFKCLYDMDDEAFSEIHSKTSQASQCLEKSPSIKLMKDCGSPHQTSGTMLCVNSTLVENSKVTAIERNCQEKIGPMSKSGCEFNPDDQFTTCTCNTNGCNVELFDVSKVDEVDDEEGDEKHKDIHNNNHHNSSSRHNGHAKNRAAAGLRFKFWDLITSGGAITFCSILFKLDH